jgi:hypothetical protein
VLLWCFGIMCAVGLVMLMLNKKSGPVAEAPAQALKVKSEVPVVVVKDEAEVDKTIATPSADLEELLKKFTCTEESLKKCGQATTHRYAYYELSTSLTMALNNQMKEMNAVTIECTLEDGTCDTTGATLSTKIVEAQSNWMPYVVVLAVLAVCTGAYVMVKKNKKTE